MANLTTRLSINAGGKSFSFANSFNYNEVFSIEQIVDYSDGGLTLAQFTPGTLSAASLEGAKFICIYNPSGQTAEISYYTTEWTAGNPDTTAGSNVYISKLLRPSEYIVIPNLYMVDYSTTTSPARGGDAALEKAEPNGKVDSSANVKSGDLNNTTDPVTFKCVTAGNSEFFKVGDYIIVDTEVLLITAIDGSNNITADRGQLGSDTATHATTPDIYYHFYNNYVDYDQHSVVQTDSQGKYKSTILPAGDSDSNHNARGTTTDDGIVLGSLTIQFYTKGAYQELGLSGITSSTNSGLTASTAYQFNITVDGGSAYALSFTTDSSNLNFGGTNGIIQKIQDVFNTQYYTTSSNLFEKKVTVSIVNGDIRFTSGSNLSTSAISLGDSSGGDTDIWGVGRFPAVANVEGAVGSDVPDETIIKNGITTHNNSEMAMDDGNGNITGMATGTIDYETTAITLTNAPPNAEMKIGYIFDSALSGGIDDNNILARIRARSTSRYRNARIQILAFN